LSPPPFWIACATPAEDATVPRPDERTGLLREFNESAFRLELQPAYIVPYEEETVARLVAGDPEPPTNVPELKAWYEQVARQVAEGKTMGRVRVHDEPPTPYQRWVRFAGAWNIAAGETIRYMTRAHAHAVGLLPDAGSTDWWLLDSRQLMEMRYDENNQLLAAELVTDPDAVMQACAWRDLAVEHSVADTASTTARK
jgi:hypothetical protein